MRNEKVVEHTVHETNARDRNSDKTKGVSYRVAPVEE